MNRQQRMKVAVFVCRFLFLEPLTLVLFRCTMRQMPTSRLGIILVDDTIDVGTYTLRWRVYKRALRLVHRLYMAI